MLFLKKSYRNIFLLLLLVCHTPYTYSENSLLPLPDIDARAKGTQKNVTQSNLAENLLIDTSKNICKKLNKLSYYIYIDDFVNSFIEITTSDVSDDSSTLSSRYLAGRAPIYNVLAEQVGTCSASFLCLQTEDGIYTDISNYLSVNNGLIVTWFTPTTLINLELDSIVHSMVTECIVIASTKVGYNPFYGKKFNMIVSSDDEKIYFDLSKM